MAEPETNKKTSSTPSSIMPDWSQLPEELLYHISTHLEEENCFDVVHARSVCRTWRSLFPFPSSLLQQSYSLPSFLAFPLESKDLCTLQKIPLFLFRVKTPLDSDAAEYFVGAIGRDESEEDHMELLPSPLQCSAKLKIRGSDPTLLNMLDCQIIPLGHQIIPLGNQYRANGNECRHMAFLPLDKEGAGGRGEFVVFVDYRFCLEMLTSAEMRWKRFGNIPCAFSLDIVTFRGRFYVSCDPGNTFVIDPYSLEVTLLFPVPKNTNFLVPCGDDELFLIEEFVGGLDISQLTFRVSRLDEEAGKWVEVNNLGDRVLFVGGPLRNVSFSAKELPYGCGLTGNSILFFHRPSNVTFAFKYGVHTGNAEDDLNCWRSSRENRVMILHKYSPVLAFQVER